MDVDVFIITILFFLAVDAVLMIKGIRKEAPKLRFCAHGIILLQALFYLLGAWYFCSDFYTETPQGYRDGFIEMGLCLIGVGVFVIVFLISAAVGHWRRVRDMTKEHQG